MNSSNVDKMAFKKLTSLNSVMRVLVGLFSIRAGS